MAKSISQLPQVGALVGSEEVEVSQLSTTVLITATTISAQASDNSYNDSGDGFIAAGFAVGDRVNVEGFTGNAANNLYSAEITSLTAGKMIIGGSDGDAIVDDAAGESVTITRWESTRGEYGGGGGGSVSIEGSKAEIYELTLSTQQDNVTGDGTEYQIPYDTEAAARDWASNSGGVVTLDAGTYLIHAGARISGGDGGADSGSLNIKIGGVKKVDSSLFISDETTIVLDCAYVVTLTASATLEASVIVSDESTGAMPTYDIYTDNAETYLRVTRLPVYGPKVLIEEIENVTAGEFDFNNITAGFKRLIIEGTVNSDASVAQDQIHIFLNSDLTPANYHTQENSAVNGAAVVTESALPYIGSAAGASTPANSSSTLKIVIENYEGSQLKIAIGTGVNYAGADFINAFCNSVVSAITAAITRIRLRTDNHPTDQLTGKLRLYGEF